jgi:DNA polymerase I-like protein with 3'-5' exonuclease and polymerase domains
MTTEKTLGLVCTQEELESYGRNLKALVGQAKVFVRTDSEFPVLTGLEAWAKQRGITGIFTTRSDVLAKLIHVDSKPNLDNYQGSYFKRNDLEWVILPPLEQTQTVPYGKFISGRFLSKLTEPDSWQRVPEFSYSLFEPGNAESTFERFRTTDLIAIDIETRPDLTISCVGYTAVFLEGSSGRISTLSYTVPLTDLAALAWIRKLNALPIPKVFQNGKYDCAYLSRYNAVPEWYLFDTANAMHSWYAELPKDLGFIQSFFVRTAAYWKDLAKTGNLADHYLYCAKDTWATAIGFCYWLIEAPEWAKRNYAMEFPVVAPSHFCELLGIRVDFAALQRARQNYSTKLEEKQESLNKMLGGKQFNTGSPKQKLALLAALGYQFPKNRKPSTKEQELKKAAFQHPLNARILNKVIEIQKDRKLLSTYLWDKDDPTNRKEFHGRVLYSLNPHGTDTGRNASREGQFWSGIQIHNVPRGDAVKQIFVADADFLFGECDLEQAESRDTAYISGCESLIRAVSGDKDFHSVNASAFFGIPYEAIYDSAKRKTLDKPLRDLSKRVNHGANYNMGAAVLVDTMGYEKVMEAKKLLKLPAYWDMLAVAEHLLACFHKTYPEISKVYYPWVCRQIAENKMLTCATGWTRYCFSDPSKSKQALNAYVAHPPQSLNAMVLNRAFVRVFLDLQMHSEHSRNFRLLAQIHDSILFQYRKGHDYLCREVKKRMEIPVTVTGADGKVRTFTVPAAVKTSPNATHWNLTGD